MKLFSDRMNVGGGGIGVFARRVCMHVQGIARSDPRVIREATTLIEAGFNVSIVDIEGEAGRSATEDVQGISLRHVLMPNWYVSTRFPLSLLKAAQMFIRTTFRLIRTPTDVYHAHDAPALPATYIAARLRRKPLVFDAHELPLAEMPLSKMSLSRRSIHPLLTRLFVAMLPRCAGIIATSSSMAREICNTYHIPVVADKSAMGAINRPLRIWPKFITPEISVVRNFPFLQTVSKNDRLRQHLGLGPDVRIVLYQGNIQPDRELDRIVRAAAFLEENIVIVMMGKADEATLIQLESLIESLRVADRVKIIPPVPYAELLEWTASADLGLVIFSPDYTPHMRVCLPNKLFEYLMAGLPVLAAPLEAVAEVINTYDVGHVLSPGEVIAPAEVGRAINTMLADQDALARMRRNALDAAQHEFFWEKERLQLVHLYHKIFSLEGRRVWQQSRIPVPTRRGRFIAPTADLSAPWLSDDFINTHNWPVVCMHVLGKARTDVRAMRTATTLTEAGNPVWGTGIEVSLIDIEGEDNCGQSAEEINGVRVNHILVPDSFITTRFKQHFLLRAADMFIRSTLRLLRTPADVYHALDLPALPACYIAARVHRKPLIFEAYELPLSTLPTSEMSTSRRAFQALFKPLLTHIVRYSTAVITVSPPLVQEMRRRYSIPVGATCSINRHSTPEQGSRSFVPQDKLIEATADLSAFEAGRGQAAAPTMVRPIYRPEIFLIRNIPEYKQVPKNDRLRQHLGLSQHVRIALYQGNLQPDRGLDRLIRSATFLDPNIVIVLIGSSSGTTRSQLETLIAAAGIADRVKIIPPVPYAELLEWTASADIGLAIYDPNYSPNVQMMLPNKLFEYLMAGLPVLSSPIEPIVDVLSTYDVGKVVTSLAPADVATAINTMLADPAALDRMHRNALHAAQHVFCWEKEKQTLIDLYDKIVRANELALYGGRDQSAQTVGPEQSCLGGR